MRKNIYLISYIIFREDGMGFSVGNMCSEVSIKNTDILQEAVAEIEKNSDVKGKVWITNMIKLK